jgi:hypothetical protein
MTEERAARHPRLVDLALLLSASLIMLVVLKIALQVTGLFPPQYNDGDPEVGWRSAQPEADWVSVDNLPSLRALYDLVPLCNTFVYHIEPETSEVIARREAEVLATLLLPASARRSLAP